MTYMLWLYIWLPLHQWPQHWISTFCAAIFLLLNLIHTLKNLQECQTHESTQSKQKKIQHCGSEISLE
jgi:hypothetical protein